MFRIAIFAIMISWNHAGHTQPRLTAEIEQMIAPLVEQLNQYENIRTVAVADFTDHSYQESPLGKQLAEEVQTAIVTTANKKFILIDRSQLKVLMQEAKLDGKGVLDPTMTPRLGRIQGIDLLLGGVMNFTATSIRLNVQGVHLETSGLMAAKVGMITLTPSLKELQQPTNERADNVVASAKKTKSDKLKSTPITSFVKEHLKVEALDCQMVNQQLECRFRVISENQDAHLSIYTTRSEVTPFGKEALPIRPSRIQLGQRGSDNRMTQVVHSNKPISLKVLVSSLPPPEPDYVTVTLSCYTTKLGIFSMKFNRLPISP